MALGLVASAFCIGGLCIYMGRQLAGEIIFGVGGLVGLKGLADVFVQGRKHR